MTAAAAGLRLLLVVLGLLPFPAAAGLSLPAAAAVAGYGQKQAGWWSRRRCMRMWPDRSSAKKVCSASTSMLGAVCESAAAHTHTWQRSQSQRTKRGIKHGLCTRQHVCCNNQGQAAAESVCCSTAHLCHQQRWTRWLTGCPALTPPAQPSSPPAHACMHLRLHGTSTDTQGTCLMRRTECVCTALNTACAHLKQLHLEP